MMKLLWVNPSFLDYRIPLYAELNHRCEGNFHLIYSVNRIPERCNEKILSVLGDNAHGLKNEKQFVLGKVQDFSNTHISVPYPSGLYSMIKSVKPDLIIAEGFFQFTPWALWYSVVHRIPLMIAYERTAHTERNCPWWRKIYRKLVGMFVDGYVVNGILTKEYLMSMGVKAERIFTGAMCADSVGLADSVSALSDEELACIRKSVLWGGRSRNGSCGVSYVLVGRMIPLKGVFHLLEGFLKHLEKYPYDRIVLVGDGPELPSLKEKYGDNPAVIFVGGVDYSQIYKYYAACDVFVISTLEDNWSLVMPEAMACGLPVACSIYNGCYPELVHKGENGITFDPLNRDSIVEALNYFHSVDIKAFGTRSKEIEHRFNPENTASNIMEAVKCTSEKYHPR